MAGTYYNSLNLEEAIKNLEGTKFKVVEGKDSFKETVFEITMNGEPIFKTYSTSNLQAYSRGLKEGLKH